MCEYDFDNTYYFGGRNDVSSIITQLGLIKFVENAYTYNDNENIIQELYSMFNN